MNNSKTIGSKIFNILNYGILTFMCILSFYPLLYVLFASFSSSYEMAHNNGILLKPEGFTLEAYSLLLKHPLLLSSYKNTLIIVLCGTFVNLFMSSLGAYGLSRKTVAFSKQMTLFMVFTMYFSGGLIPVYLLIKTLGLRNSLLSLIIPGAVSTYNLLIMRTSFQGIPDSLEESARLDGANDWDIFIKIILPLSKAILAVMGLFYGVSHWNAWFGATIYITDRAKMPLQVLLREILIQNSTQASGDMGDAEKIRDAIKYSAIIVATAPILLAYPFLQKYFVKGVMVGAIKG